MYMDYFLSDTWDELDNYYEHYSDSNDDPGDNDFYEDDDLEFIQALYPILEYTCSESEEICILPKRVSNEWVFEKMFSLDHEAIAAVNSEETWRTHRKKYTPEGLKVVYRCNKLHKEGPQCAAKIYLLYHHATSSIMLYRTVSKHDHENILETLDNFGIKNKNKKKRLRQTSIVENFLTNKKSRL